MKNRSGGLCDTADVQVPQGLSAAGLTDVVDLRAAESNSVRVECAVTAEEQEWESQTSGSVQEGKQ